MSSATVIRQARAEGIRPDRRLTVSEWADQHRRLPKKAAAEPGPWRTSRTPYLREIMDCMSVDSDAEEIVVMSAAQIGKTEVILNTLGYIIDHAPGPAIIVQPTVEMAKRFSRQRLEPLIADTPRLAGKVANARARDSGNTVLTKSFPGGLAIITGANSAVGLRSMPAQWALMDEISAYPIDVDEEGSPLALVEARQRTFVRRKRIKVSTPTVAGRCAVESAYLATDQRRYYVPCPDCGEMQPLEFQRLTWSKLGLPAERAVYECRACFFPIQNHHKTEMLSRGEWKPEKPERVGKIRGYHLNGLYAPVGWMSWGEIASQFAKVHRDPEKHRVFINTVLGEVWTSRGEAPEWEGLMRRRGTYQIGTVPMGAMLLTAGVDVQKDRIVYEVVGWGRGKRSWSIDYGILPGETADLQRGPWAQVDALVARSYPHEGGVHLPIRMVAIDSGYNSQTVYGWARKYPMNRVIAVDGRHYGGVLIGAPSPVEVTDRGRKLKRGYRIWPVSKPIANSELYGWLMLQPPVDGEETPPGFCEFPQYDDEFFKQLTAEQLVTHKSRKGYVEFAWEQIPGRENHALDCRVYARAAAMLAGLDRFQESDWQALERSIGHEPTPTPPPVAAAVVVRPEPVKAAQIRRSSWLGERQGSWLRGRR